MPTSAETVTTIGSFFAKAKAMFGKHFRAVCETHVVEHDMTPPNSEKWRTAVEDTYALPKFTPCNVTLMPPLVTRFMVMGLAAVITGASNENVPTIDPTSSPMVIEARTPVDVSTVASRLRSGVAQRMAVSVSHAVLAHWVRPKDPVGLGFAVMKLAPYSVTLVLPEVAPFSTFKNDTAGASNVNLAPPLDVDVPCVLTMK